MWLLFVCGYFCVATLAVDCDVYGMLKDYGGKENEHERVPYGNGPLPSQSLEKGVPAEVAPFH